MDLEYLNQKRQKLETQAQNKIQEALNDMKDDLSKTNEYVANQLKKEMDVPNKDKENVDVQPQTQQTQQPQQQPIQHPSMKIKPLIYFSYPMMDQPSWVIPLRDILVRAGYLVYNPIDDINAQFGQQDLPDLNSARIKIVKSICNLLHVPEEVMLPFDAVWKLIEKGDTFDNYGITFQRLWFLVRSSLVICDLMVQPCGASLGQELLYSKQFGIPTIGLIPTTGQIDPFAQRTTTTLFSGNDLISLLPIIKGYSPD